MDDSERAQFEKIIASQRDTIILLTEKLKAKPLPIDEGLVERVARAIWREDHYDPKLCSCDSGCAYCEPHDDDTPNDWPADKERAERQSRAAIEVMLR